MIKKTWFKPVMTVLVKGTSEESVLWVCKQLQASAPGPMGNQGACKKSGNVACNLSIAS